MEPDVKDREKKEKTVTIVVNGTPYEVPKKEMISYAEVAALAYPGDTGIFSITYMSGHGDKPEGILSPGGSVKVKEHMSFHVERTGQS